MSIEREDDQSQKTLYINRSNLGLFFSIRDCSSNVMDVRAESFQLYMLILTGLNRQSIRICPFTLYHVSCVRNIHKDVEDGWLVDRRKKCDSGVDLLEDITNHGFGFLFAFGDAIE